jgi:hypothetical protein
MSATEEAYSGEEATEDATEQQEEDATTAASFGESRIGPLVLDSRKKHGDDGS